MAGAAHQSQRSYEDFEPSCKWHQLENVVQLHLQGFKKEHLTVRTTSSGMLTIHGERPPDRTNTKWIRFHKEMKLPTNCDTSRVAAKFYEFEGTLTITMPPKVDAPVPPQVHESQAQNQAQAQSRSPDTQTNNDKAIVKIIRKTPDNNSGATTEAALHDKDDAARTPAGPMCLASNSRFKLGKYPNMAVKVVLVVAVLVGVGLGAYVKYIKPSYSLEDMD